MTEESKKWFVEKIAQNPEYLAGSYLPALDRQIKKFEVALREANRVGDLSQIKYATGLLDGAEKLRSVIDGLRISEGKAPRPGLMDRISQMFDDRTTTPAGLG